MVSLWGVDAVDAR